MGWGVQGNKELCLYIFFVEPNSRYLRTLRCSGGDEFRALVGDGVRTNASCLWVSG